MLVRSLRTAVRIPGAEAPYDTAHVTVRYPALAARDDVERMSGRLAVDPAGAPYPVVVLVSGVNCPADAYRWLAFRLVEAGFVVVGYDWVGQLFPGEHGLTPGVDIVAAGPEHYGERPTTPALGPVLEAVAGLNEAGQLAGLLDLDKVGLFGHSAGGTVILQSARPAWFPQVRAVVSYGGHTMASQMIGYPPNTLLPAPVEAPTLIVAGTHDGVVAASAIRYGEQPGAAGHDPIERTWREALPETTESWLVHLEGAGHMLASYPEDPSTARGFLETPTDADHDRLREVLGDLVATFLSAHLHGSADAKAELEELADHPRPEFAGIRRR
ncbi:MULTISPECIES: alpha/beta hydrolase family protein [unclassified Nocardioides]|uniref:alpha/beta hydrolase family protein n=1 Tax=unclassified Nocardioides TaxID=2615069 RepID=UPI0009E844BB|nr:MULTISPECIES: dienelactone hydrolase family protein [unclassified Nocardioides]